MKYFGRLITLVGLVFCMMAASFSCSTSNMTTDIDGKRVRKSADAVSRKNEPLPKNFILKEKKRAILGQEK
jgi:hypothetical protein